MVLDVSEYVMQDGDNVSVMLNWACPAGSASSEEQTFCSEMLHWDEYREEKAINDGAPTMASLFKTSGDAMLPFVVDNTPYVPRSVAVRDGLQSADCQTFCAEMQHWDDYRVRRKLFSEGEPTMRSTFFPFAGKKVVLYDRVKGELTWALARTVAAQGRNHHMYCAEMEHLNDYNEAKGIMTAPSMRALFGAPS